MTPSARTQSVIELLTLIETTPRPADAVVSNYFRARRYIGSKDRAFVSALVYGILRHTARLGWWLEKEHAQVSPRTRLLAYLALVDKAQPHDLAELFSGKKYAPTALSDAEKDLVKKLAGAAIEPPEMPQSIAVECPAWAEAALRKYFGKAFARELKAMLEPATLDLRINPLKTSRDIIFAELKKADFNALLCPLSPLGLRLIERPALNSLPMLKEGLVEIQDEGSQLVAMLMDAKPGERIVDFCAGAGGKTLAIAAQMNNKGHIIACDVLEKRLSRSTERFRKAGLHNIEIKPLKSEHDPWVKRHKGSFDRVLVDAPCSGTGTWRRNPDARYRSLGPGLEALLPLQASILESAARLLKPGGRLLYATCSLLAEENDEQAEKFLAAHADFTLLDYTEVWRDKLAVAVPGKGPYLKLTPHQHGTDGFFAALFQKKVA